MSDRRMPGATGPARTMRKRHLGLAAGVTAGLFLFAPGCATQTAAKPGVDPLPGTSPHQKINRQVDLFERLIDDTLVESEHALVRGGRNASGAYLEGLGAVFAFELSLVGGRSLLLSGRGGVPRLELEDLPDLDLYLDFERDIEIAPKERLRDRRQGESGERKGDRSAEADDPRPARERMLERRTRQYIHVKEELVSLLAKSGDVLDRVPANEWVVLVGRASAGSWGERKIETLVIKARRRDMSDCADGKIDDVAFRKRVIVEEYPG